MSLLTPDGRSDHDLLIDAQELACRLQDWPAVLAFGEHLGAEGTLSARSYSAQFDAQLHLGNRQAAEDTLREALSFYPGSHAITVKWARLATVQADYSAAIDRWRAVIAAHPQIEECYITGSFCLTQLGDTQGAADLLNDGRRIFPTSFELWFRYVDLALRAGELAEAKNRWELQQAEFLNDARTSLIGAEIAVGGGDLSQAERLLSDSIRLSGGSETTAHMRVRHELDSQSLKMIMIRFESLGGRVEGCEFGLVQRAYGAEPLGLLRWADMGPDALIDALESRFEGVGEPDTTVLVSPHTDGADWTTHDTRFGMNMHTFQFDKPTDETRTRMYNSTVRRLRFLRDKLLTELSLGEKVFVYKVTYEVLDPQKLLRLFGAIRRYGDCGLLYVRQPDDEHPAGTVEWAQPGLMVGYIERFSYAFGHGGSYIGPATACWATIIRAAYDLWEASKDTQPDAYTTSTG